MSEIIFIMGYNYDSNCYLINGNTLVDTGAGQNKDYLFSMLRENGVDPKDIELVVNTHCHFDHLFCLNKIRKGKIVAGTKECSRNMITPHISLCDLSCIPEASCDMKIDEGEYDFSGIKIKVIKTPGHTDGCVCFLVDK